MSKQITNIKSIVDLYTESEIKDALHEWGMKPGDVGTINATIIGMLRDGITTDKVGEIEFRTVNDTQHSDHVIVVDNCNIVVGSGWYN